jgi:nucleotide-binding universal stress UspA family protein
MTFHRILVPVDFSAAARGAFEYATTLAQTLGSEIVVLHAVDVPSLGGQLHLRTPGGASESIETLEMRHAQRTLDAWLAVRLAGARVSPRVEKGRPAVRILAAASDLGCDLVVMGVHGPKRRLLGGVTEKVVRRASCPVLVVPTEERPPLEAVLASVPAPVGA